MRDLVDLILMSLKIFVLSYLGIAAVTGQRLNVGIIVRSLTDSMAFVAEDQLPLVFNADFWATLDMGRTSELGRGRNIADYALTWWTSRKPRNLDNVDILADGTLVLCLDYHRRQLDASPVSSASPSPGPRKTPADSLPTMEADIGAAVLMPAMAEHWSDGEETTGQAIACPKCPLYRDALRALRQEVEEFNRYAKTLATTADTECRRDMRRAAAFYDLYEAALLKETAVTPSAPTGSRSERVKEVSATAAAEFK
jgi:hypothetical protein